MLEFVEADARYWHQKFLTDETSTGTHVILVSPGREELLDALAAAARHLSSFGPDDGQLDFAFAGHANNLGHLCLAGGETVTMTEILDHFIDAPGVVWRPFIGIVLDCCFAARALADAICHPGNPDRFAIIDAFAAALNDEDRIRPALQAFVPNPVTYLTEGEQTSVDLINNHHLEINGGGSFEIPEVVTMGEFLRLLNKARAEPALN